MTLPALWEETTFGEVIASIRNGYNVRQNKEGTGLAITRIETIATGEINLNRVGYGEGVPADFRLREGDILFSHINSGKHIGKTAIVSAQHGNLYHGINLLRFQLASGIEPRFFEAQCRLMRMEGTFSLRAQHAVNQASLNQGAIRSFTFKLAPLPEQQRIVAKIDCLTSKSKRAGDHLGHIPRLVEMYKQAVLAAAFRGDLTREWRACFGPQLPLQDDLIADEHSRIWTSPENKARRGAYRAPAIPARNHGIESWREISLEHIAFVVDPHPSHRTPPRVDGGVPYIGLGDVDQNGNIDFVNARPVSPEILEEHRSRYAIRQGDFAFGKIGTLGEPFLLPEDQEFTLSANVILVQPRASFALATYVFMYFGSAALIAEISESSNATSQAAFGIKKLRDITLPLPPREEQQEIVRRVRSAFVWIDRLASDATSARKLIDRLNQAVLTKAFRGELVPQDPNDEPASALLERIKKGGGDATKSKRGRKTQA